MALSTYDVRRYHALVDKLKTRLPELTMEELTAVNAVVEAFLSDHSSENPYHPLTEKQLIERIDLSLTPVEQGLCQDSEEMEAELMAEFDL